MPLAIDGIYITHGAAVAVRYKITKEEIVHFLETGEAPINLEEFFNRVLQGQIGVMEVENV